MLEQYLGLNGYLGTTDRAVLLANGTGGLVAQASALTIAANSNCLTIPGGAITASEPLLNLSQTWNNAGVAFTGLKFDVTDSNSASGSLLADFRVGGSSKFSVNKIGNVTAYGWRSNASGSLLVDNTTVNTTYIASTGVFLPVSGALKFSGNTDGATSPDVFVERDAANTLALRNGVNAQAFNIYNTWGNSGTDYERLNISYSGNIAYIRTENGGTGLARVLVIGTKTASNLTFCTNDNYRWGVHATTGALYANSDNSYDIGINASSNRPRTGYFGTSVVTPNVTFGNGTILTDDAANTLALRNGVNAQALNIYNTWGNSGTDYERLNISYSGNVAYIQTMNGGTGSARQLVIGTKTASNLTFCTNDNYRWGVHATTGALYANSDNSYDIGASGATRPRTGYFGTSVIAPAIKLNQGTTTTLAKAGGTLAGLPNVTAVGNVGGGEDDLMTYTIPANTLATNGDTLVFEGLFTAVESARIKAYFNATQIGYNGYVLVADDAPGCIVRIILTRLSATTACASLEGGTGAYGLNNEAALMTGLDFTASNTFKFTGQSDGGTPADNDVVQRSLIGRYYPAN